MRKVSVKSENSNMYKFYLLNLGMSPSRNEVARALDNLTIDDLSPCKAMNITGNHTNSTIIFARQEEVSEQNVIIYQISLPSIFLSSFTQLCILLKESIFVISYTNSAPNMNTKYKKCVI